MANINKADEYPRQCASIVQNKTLSCDAWLSRAVATKGQPPLEIFNTKTDGENKIFASRFSLCLISDEKEAATGNISLEEMESEVFPRTEFVANESYKREITPAVTTEKSETNSPAYTVKFKAGNLKGKTPAQVLIEEGEEAGKETLTKQYKFLKSNLPKYKDNQIIMDAINDASRLLKEGKLNEENVSSVSNDEFVIFDSGMKPLIRKKHPKNNDLSKVYEIKIVADFSRRYPIRVNIQNYYAPVEKKEDGTLNVKKSALDKSTFINNDINLVLSTYLSFIAKIKRCIAAYERAYSLACLKEAEELISKQLSKFTNSTSDMKNVEEPKKATKKGEPTPMIDNVEEPKHIKVNMSNDAFSTWEDELPFN